MNFIDAIKEAQKGKEIYRTTPIRNGQCRYLHLWEAESWERNFGTLILGSRSNTQIPLPVEDILADDWEACEYGTR